MLVFDLSKPDVIASSWVYDTDQPPFVALQEIADRSQAVMMGYNIDLAHIAYSVVAFDPANGKHITIDEMTPERAIELAQAEYQRDTSPARAVQ